MDEKKRRIMNRIGGLAMGGIGWFFIYATKDFGLEDIVGTLFILEGAGDLISGSHHYVTTNIIRYLSKGKIDIRYGKNAKYDKNQK